MTVIFSEYAVEGDKEPMRREYKNLQFRTVPEIGIWSRLSQKDLDRLEGMQNDGWEVFQVVNIRGSLGFTSHVVFMLSRELEE